MCAAGLWEEFESLGKWAGGSLRDENASKNTVNARPCSTAGNRDRGDLCYSLTNNLSEFFSKS